MPAYNLHQHSTFSDGAMPPEAFVKQAILLGFTAIGFSEHSPLPFDNPFSLRSDRVAEYVQSIRQLKAAWKDQINIYRALEMDFIPTISEDFAYWKTTCQTDYLIGSIHLVKPPETEALWFTDGPNIESYDEGLARWFDGDIKKAVRTFYHQTNQMISSQDFDVLGHFDKIKMHNRNRFFREDESWYQQLVDETLDLVRQKNLIVEVNTRGWYKKRSPDLFPGQQALQKVKDLNIPVMLSSDAHHPDELNQGFAEATTLLKEVGFRSVMYFEGGSWQEQPLS